MSSDEVKIGEKIIEIITIRGEVIDSSKAEITHVEGGGGGGGGVGGNVNVAPVHISSYSTTKHEFWIKREDGIEVSIILNDSNLRVRTGQIVTNISIRLKGSESTYLMIVVNHSSGMWQFIAYDSTLHKIVSEKLIGWLRIIFLPLLIILCSNIVPEALFMPAFTLGPLLFIYLIVSRRQRVSQNKSLVKELYEHLTGMADTILREA